MPNSLLTARVKSLREQLTSAIKDEAEATGPFTRQVAHDRMREISQELYILTAPIVMVLDCDREFPR